jgi:hypothetical protein
MSRNTSLSPIASGRFEAVVADHIASQAGQAAQPVGHGLLAGLARADDHRAVRHLEDVGHVRGRRGIEDRQRHAVVDESSTEATSTPVPSAMASPGSR